MDKYDHNNIEPKWQKKWGEDKTYAFEENSTRPKYYVLNEFPYPSGEGLHVGHLKGNIGTDIHSRFRRMSGMNVLHPMGWDAFGLPAENYAIKNKLHPRESVTKNIQNFKTQIIKMGLDYSWDNEIDTTDPAYYKWTQWAFIQMFKKGLAYESNEPINWCPSCLTGLANEDLDGDKCERCGSVVEKKKLRQWVIRITDYADRLLEDLEELDWPEHIKEMQRAWIGRSQGLIFSSHIRGTDIEIETYSAHFEFCYADTFITIAPDHPKLSKIIEGVENEKEIRAKIEEINLGRLNNKYGEGEMEGVFTGQFLADKVTGKDLPIWVASFVIADYGTGAVRSSAYDKRDLAFATKYNIPLVEIEPEIDKELFEKNLIKVGHAKPATMYRLKDWVFSRQRYWGEPIPLIHCLAEEGKKCGVVAVPDADLPVTLPDVKNYEPTGTGESPLAAISDWVNVKCPNCGGAGKRETNTMPQWAGSSWYYLRFMDAHNKDSLVGKEKEKYWSPVDLYIGGAEHTTRHLVYARFWHKFLFDIGVVGAKEPFAKRLNLGLILGPDGRKMSKRLGNVVNPNEVVERFGADTVRIFMMFLGPYADTVVWEESAMIGSRRFIERVWALAERLSAKTSSETAPRLPGLGTDIKNISSAIRESRFNIAIPFLMTLVSRMTKAENLNKLDFEILLKLLAPFAPHVAEELWSQMGHSDSIHKAAWPLEAEAVKDDLPSVIALPVQINGKIRGRIIAGREAPESEIIEALLASKELIKWLPNGEIGKMIYKKGQVVSLTLDHKISPA